MIAFVICWSPAICRKLAQIRTGEKGLWMNTPAHLLLGVAVMGRTGQARLIWAALVGALLPDVSLYVLAGVSLHLLNIPASVVFSELYYSDRWQAIFAIDNSFLVWGALAGAAIWRRSGWAMALTGAALLHLCFDLPLHHDDGRAHFWPLTGWVFESPVSYWDPRHGAVWVAPLEAALAAVAAIGIWRLRAGVTVSALAALLLAAEFLAVQNWIFFFGS
jgi:hypothetical protein